MTVIKTVNLTKTYKDVVAIDGLNLEIKEGELFSLLGLNGAGKTTTIKMLTTLIKPTSGEAFVCGHSVVKEKDAVKELIDISMQETAIAKNLTVSENIEFYLALDGKSKSEIAQIKNDLIEKFDFKAVASKRACKLSGGWQRKLSIALALASSPKILFLDEPTLGLDVIARRELWKLIQSLKGKVTVVLTTHYMEEAEALSDRIGVIKDGKLLFVGTKSELFALTKTSSVEEAFISVVGGDYELG